MALKMSRYNVCLELIEDLLGTVPKAKNIFTAHVQRKAREEIEKAHAKGIPLASGEAATEESVSALMEEEVQSVEDLEERGWTGFLTDELGPYLMDYHLKAMMKEAARTLKEHKPKGAKVPIKQLQDKINRFTFVRPRKIRLPAVTGTLERPLRASTAQGPRVTLVRSDVIAAGATLSFSLHVLAGGGVDRELLQDIFSYGEFQGLGQWRSGGYGRVRVLTLETEED